MGGREGARKGGEGGSRLFQELEKMCTVVDGAEGDLPGVGLLLGSTMGCVGR